MSKAILTHPERDVLDALAAPNTRWLSVAQLVDRTGHPRIVVSAALSNLRRRELVTTDQLQFGSVFAVKWSITTLGDAERVQLRLAG